LLSHNLPPRLSLVKLVLDWCKKHLLFKWHLTFIDKQMLVKRVCGKCNFDAVTFQTKPDVISSNWIPTTIENNIHQLNREKQHLSLSTSISHPLDRLRVPEKKISFWPNFSNFNWLYTEKLSYNQIDYNEQKNHSEMTILLRKRTRLQQTLVITSKSGWSRAVRYNRVWLYMDFYLFNFKFGHFQSRFTYFHVFPIASLTAMKRY